VVRAAAIDVAAGNVTVNNGNGSCSLREAIINSTFSGNTVQGGSGGATLQITCAPCSGLYVPLLNKKGSRVADSQWPFVEQSKIFSRAPKKHFSEPWIMY